MARILVIEDDRVQRFAAVRALQAAGHEVIEAVDGEEGVQRARAMQPDLVVCDVRMPHKDGYAVLKELRADRDLYALPIILLTSMTERESMRQGMASGADDYLTKPFRFQELVEAVSVLLRKRKSYFDQAINTIGPKYEAALEAHTRELAEKYEHRLMRELDNRWGRQADSAGGLGYAHAALLAVDVFGGWSPDFGQPPQAQAAQNAFQSTRDVLHLFAPAHVIAHGSSLLAVYPDGPGTGGGESPGALRALRAAWACVQRPPLLLEIPGAPATLAPRAAVHEGPVSLLQVKDVLHGDGECTLVSGATADEVLHLLSLATQQGWRSACSEAVAARAGGALRQGSRSTAGPGAVEIAGVEESA